MNLSLYGNTGLFQLAQNYLRMYNIHREVYNERLSRNSEEKGGEMRKVEETPDSNGKSDGQNLANYIFRNNSSSIGIKVLPKSKKLLGQGNIYIEKFNLVGKPRDIRDYLLSQGYPISEINKELKINR